VVSVTDPSGRISRFSRHRWNHILKNWGYENLSTAVSVNNFKHLMMTILVKSCSVMWCGETFKVNNF
jgi:hypothetical protein